jgi:hypothetical protein
MQHDPSGRICSGENGNADIVALPKFIRRKLRTLTARYV